MSQIPTKESIINTFENRGELVAASFIFAIALQAFSD